MNPHSARWLLALAASLAAGVKTYNDTGATNGAPYFFRVGVQ